MVGQPLHFCQKSILCRKICVYVHPELHFWQRMLVFHVYYKIILNRDVCKTLMPPFPNIQRIGVTFDLDLWPTNLNINRGHLLIKEYLPTKFEASGAKHSWVISCTRLRDTDILTYRPTCAKQYAPPFSKGGINIYHVSFLLGLSIYTCV